MQDEIRQLSVNHLRIQPLPLHQFSKPAPKGNQLIIGAILRNLSFFQIDDPVAVSDRGQAVGDHDAGTLELLQRVGNGLLSDVIQRGGGLVKHEDFGLGSDGGRS